MTTEKSTGTVAAAVEQQEQATRLGSLIAQYQEDFARVLPSHIAADHWVRLAQGVLRRDAKLAEAARANPGSLLSVLLDCARLGHEPGTDQYAIVAYGGEITGIEQYQGEIERMYRSGAVRTVRVDVVRQNDLYEYEPDRMSKPRHRKGWYCSEPPGSDRHARFLSDEQRGELVGVYAYAELTGGATSHVVEMGRDTVMKHREMARTKKIWDGPWQVSMWLKTGVHELEKFVPASAEFLRVRLRASAEAQHASSATPVAEPAEARETVVDAEIVDAPTELEGGAS